MNRRIVSLLAVFCIALVPLVAGCPGEDALTQGLTSGISDGIASVVEDLLAGALGG